MSCCTPADQANRTASASVPAGLSTSASSPAPALARTASAFSASGQASSLAPTAAGRPAATAAAKKTGGCCSKRTQRAAEAAVAVPQAPAPAPASAVKAAASGCCRSAKAASRQTGGLATGLAALGPLPQYRHAFVEGCTCGGGVMGCCPCTVGLAEHGALRAGAGQPGCSAAAGPQAQQAAHVGHNWAMAGAGALGLVGLYMGARAIWTNAEAQGRVTRAHAHNAELGWTLAARQQAAAGVDGLGDVVARRLTAIRGRAAQLASSLAERRFNVLVPGALQVVGSSFLILASIQHFGLQPLAGLPFAGLATGVLAGYAAIYAVRALWRAADAWRGFAAVRQLPSNATDAADAADAAKATDGLAGACAGPGDGPGPAYLAALRKHSKTQLFQRGLTAVAWTTLAAGSTAVLALPALGASAGLAGVVGAAQLAAVAASLAWPAPVHTPSSPRLDEVFAAGAIALPKLRASWWAAAQQQTDVLQAAGAALLAGDDMAARWQRQRHRLEPWTTPQCGPDAYRTIATRFVAGLQQTGSWPAVIDAAVADYLAAEASWLRDALADGRAQLAALAAAPAPAGPTTPAAPTTAVAAQVRAQTQEELRTLVDGVRVASADKPEGSERVGGLQARLAAAEALAAQWRALAEAPQRGGSAERQVAMVQTLAAVGLLAEAAGGLVSRQPSWFYATGAEGKLAFAHAILRPERAEAFAEAMGPNLAFAFVRCLFNPNRLVAEQEEALAAGTFVARQPGGLAGHGEAGVAAALADANRAFGPACSRCEA